MGITILILLLFLPSQYQNPNACELRYDGTKRISSDVGEAGKDGDTALPSGPSDTTLVMRVASRDSMVLASSTLS